MICVTRSKALKRLVFATLGAVLTVALLLSCVEWLSAATGGEGEACGYFTGGTARGDSGLAGNNPLYHLDGDPPTAIPVEGVDYFLSTPANGGEWFNRSDINRRNFFTIRPNPDSPEGYTKISLDPDGASGWFNYLEYRDDTDSGRVTFYLLNADDSAGVVSLPATVEYKIDGTAPTITLEYVTDPIKRITEYRTFGLFFRDSVDLRILVADTTSGVCSCLYQKVGLNGQQSHWIDCADGEVVTIEGNFGGRILVQAVDNAGNSSPYTGSYFVVDRGVANAPVVSADGYPGDCWTNKDVDITLSGSSVLANIDRYEYSTDQIEWVVMPGSDGLLPHEELGKTIQNRLTLTDNTDQVYYFRAVSNTEVAGATSALRVMLKKPLPDVQVATFPHGPNGMDGDTATGWYVSQPEIRLSLPPTVATLILKGFYKLWNESLGEQAPEEGIEFDTTQNLHLPDGKHGLITWAEAEGEAGSSLCMRVVKVDTTRPSQPVICYREQPVAEKEVGLITVGFYRDPVTVAINAEDEMSGIKRIEYFYSGQRGKDIPEFVLEAGAIVNSAGSFSIDGPFYGYVEAVAVDHAGNRHRVNLEDTRKKIVIDNAAPVVAINYEAVDTGEFEGGEFQFGSRHYYTGKVKVSISVIEDNFYTADNEFSLEVIRSNIKGTETIFPVLDWTHRGNQHEAFFELEEDGDYVISAGYDDYCENGRWTHFRNDLTLANSLPQITVSGLPPCSGNSETPVVLKGSINIFDRHFNPSNVTWETKALNLVGEETPFPTLPALSQWDNAEDYFIGTITFKEDGNYWFRVMYLDAMNRLSVKEAEFLLDNTPPTGLAVTYQGKPVTAYDDGGAGIFFFRPGVTVALAAEDATAGIDTIRYKCRVETGSSLVNQPQEGAVVSFAETDRDGVRLYQGQFTIDREFRGRITMEAEDLAGNCAEYTWPCTLVVDSISPKISVSYDNVSARNGSYYGAGRNATIVIEEANFYAEDVEVLLGKRGSKRDKYVVTRIKPRFTKQGDVYKAQVPFQESGDYTFSVRYTDKSGNEGIGFEDSFTIDRVKPLIKVLYDNNDGRNGNYYKDSRRGKIVVTDKNIAAADVQVTIKAVEEGVTKKAPAIDSWVQSGDDLTAVVNFQTDGFYTLEISCKDLAGNGGQYQENFFIDLTPPALSLELITAAKVLTAEDGYVSLKDQKIVPVMECTDRNFDPNSVDVSLVGIENERRGNDKLSFTGLFSDKKDGRTCTFENFDPGNPLCDDVYSLRARITDKAGNTTEKTMSFSVNRYGSHYDLAAVQDILVKKYIQQGLDLIVTEVNPDQLIPAGVAVTVFRDNDTKALINGDDFSIVEDHDEGDWYKYTYTIFAKNFGIEGVYQVSLSSQDAAGNLSENNMETKNCPIQFVVDATGPIVQLINLESDETYPEKVKTVHFTASDNLKLESVFVELDGLEVESWSGNELGAAGEYVFGIPETRSARTVRIVASDAAGNTCATEVSGFYVTTNVLVRFYNNKLLFFGSLVGVVLLLAGSVFLASRKGRSHVESA